jgi:hypothetical protein
MLTPYFEITFQRPPAYTTIKKLLVPNVTDGGLLESIVSGAVGDTETFPVAIFLM